MLAQKRRTSDTRDVLERDAYNTPWQSVICSGFGSRNRSFV